ncbi:ABC transporter permease [Streptomyces cinereoruber]|uniref:ABC transporter permease n=1 Tax=Streptomyces cinereoruber TaxID=67260 RepID=UPI00362516B0
MTQMQESPIHSDAPIQRRYNRGRRATLALARVESWRLLRHPAVLGTLAAYLAEWVYSVAVGGNRFPVLQDESRFTQMPLLLVAAGVFLAVHLSVLRPARDAVADVYEAAALESWQRIVAHVLSVVPLAVIAAVVSAVRVGLAAAAPGAVGNIAVVEVLTGPVVVLTAGALAALAGTAVRSTAAGPLVLTVLGVVTVASALSATSAWRWLTLVALEHESIPPLPHALLYRPTELHVAYLLGLTVSAALVAMVLSGLRSRRMTVAVAVVLAVTLGAAAAQLRPMPTQTAQAREEARTAPAGTQRCAVVEKVTYCAFPEFFDRHQQWAEVTQGILRWLPEDRVPGRLAVRQHLWAIDGKGGTVNSAPVQEWAADDAAAGAEGAVMVGTRWGNRNDADSSATIGFAAALAARLLGPQDGRGPVAQLCGGRAIVAVWLAAQATAETEQALRDRMSAVVAGTSVSFRPVDGVHTLSVDRRGVEAALTLLERPASEVGPKITRSWDTLTAPGLTVEQAAPLLGIQAHSPAQAEGGATGC